MMRPLTPLQSKTLALALLVLVFVSAVLALALPMMAVHRHYDAAIEQLVDRMARYRRIIAMTPGLKAGLERVKARNGRKFYLKNAAPALAAAEIQEIAKTIIEAQSGKLTSIQIIPHKDDGGYRQVGVNLQFSGSIASIQKILYALETRQPYLFVDNLSIRSRLMSNYRAAPGAEPEYFVQFDLTGYALIPGAA
ncbi:MAG: type II secretion system protein GspM [Sulfuricella sp.]|jgi:general secretion pathway protein M|nr:type II secretion system protein GspM [Sulfuricella sp.]